MRRRLARRALVEGPFRFDNVISAEAARMKKMASGTSSDADLLLMPDLDAGNLLYKSFTYIDGGECAGLVLGARRPGADCPDLARGFAGLAHRFRRAGGACRRPGLTDLFLKSEFQPQAFNHAAAHKADGRLGSDAIPSLDRLEHFVQGLVELRRVIAGI